MYLHGMDLMQMVNPWYGPNADGEPIVLTLWELTEQEKADIAAGKPLALQLWGISIPHLYLTTKNPFQ